MFDNVGSSIGHRSCIQAKLAINSKFTDRFKNRPISIFFQFTDHFRKKWGCTTFEGNFCDTMMMLFQLVITITILIILMLIFYLSVIYLPTKSRTI